MTPTPQPMLNQNLSTRLAQAPPPVIMPRITNATLAASKAQQAQQEEQAAVSWWVSQQAAGPCGCNPPPPCCLPPRACTGCPAVHATPCCAVCARRWVGTNFNARPLQRRQAERAEARQRAVERVNALHVSAAVGGRVHA